MKRYQIIRKPKIGTSERPARWSFVAHGATYPKAEALAVCGSIEHNSGDRTRLLPV